MSLCFISFQSEIWVQKYTVSAFLESAITCSGRGFADPHGLDCICVNSIKLLLSFHRSHLALLLLLLDGIFSFGCESVCLQELGTWRLSVCRILQGILVGMFCGMFGHLALRVAIV